MTSQKETESIGPPFLAQRRQHIRLKKRQSRNRIKKKIAGSIKKIVETKNFLVVFLASCQYFSKKKRRETHMVYFFT
jgi:Na+/melibiose symporter-like transporter